MTLLVAGLILFLFPHVWRELGLRTPIMAHFPSEGAYKGVFSLLSLAGLVLIIYGKSVAAFTMIWEPVFEMRWLSHLLMLPALILVSAGNLPMSHLRMSLRHPMLLGVLLWGIAHLWANGDLASLLLFGSFSLWSFWKLVSLHHQPRPPKQPRFAWDIIALVTGLVLYGLIFIYHGQLFGVGLTIG